MSRHAFLILLLLLIGIVWSPMLILPNYLVYPRGSQITDLTITHWPAVAFNARTLRQDGQVPLWQTTIASGGPWAANPQSWLHYPPAWLFFFLPIGLTFNLLLMAHLALAALATYAFGRQALELEPAGAALAGLAFALAPWLSGQLAAGHVNIALALAWLPVALLGAHRAATTGRISGALLAGVAWAAALVNHIQMAFFAVGLTLAWFLLVTRRGMGRVQWRSQLGLLLLMPAVALLLSAVLLVPLLEALPYLNRTTLTSLEGGVFSLSWGHLMTTLIPTYGGEAEQAIYLGIPVAVLAVLGLSLRHSRKTWFLAGTAVLAVFFALGTHTPLFALLIRWLPGLSWLRVPPRAWVLVAFSIALLAGCGLDALTRSSMYPSSRRQVTLLSLSILVMELTLAAGLLWLYRPPPLAAWVMITLALLTMVALLLRTRVLLRPTVFSTIMLILVALDLGLVRTAWTEMRAPADAFALGAEAAEYLAQKPGWFRTYSPSYSLPQHTAIAHDLYLADGVDPIQLAHYADFLSSAGGYQRSGYSPTLPPILNDTSARPDAVRLGMLSVGYVLTSFPLDAEGLVLETQLGQTHIYLNRHALPHAFVVPGAEIPDGRPILLQNPADAQPTQVRVYTPNRIVVQADLEEPGLLVLSEVWYPGWHALADGLETPIHRVGGTLRGIQLDRGSHMVEFHYTPWTVWLGIAISASAAIALLAYAASRARRLR